MKNLIRKLCFSLLIGIITSGLYLLPWFQDLEYQGLDLWFHLRGAIQPSDDVILISMDEASYDELGIPMNQAWPRTVHARLLHRLAKAGTKRVVFDVAFLGSSGDAAGDQVFSESLAALPTAIGVDSGIAPGNDDVIEVYLPYQPFRETAAELALVGLPEDSGYIRRFKTRRTSVTEKYRSLAEAGANLTSPSRRPDNNDLINHYGPNGTITIYSYADVLADDFISDDQLKDKVAYVGLLLRTELGPAQKDSFLTPFQERGRTYGVEIHAAAALNLMQDTWIKRYSVYEECLGILGATILLSLLLMFLPPGLGLVALFSSSVLWMIWAYTSFLDYTLIPGMTLIVVIAPAIYLLSTVISYLSARKRQKQTEQAFSYYLSPEMAKQVALNPDALMLGGNTVEATALFTDIADFTRISEAMEAEEVVQMLNAYFTEVMEVIFETQGTLIKFIGDAVFALWGAPITLADHPEQALRSALSIREKVQAFNDSKRFPSLFTRIGVHTGPMVVGNLGSTRRFDYTAIGDAVNLAARLEGLNKYFGIDLLLSESVVEAIEAEFRFCSLGYVSVKGKSEVVAIYTVLPEDIDEALQENWEEALTLFHHADWEKSEKIFKKLLKDKTYFHTAAQLYLKQIPYRKITGTTDWQGEIVFDVK